MADAKHGLRGTGDFSKNQRPGNFGSRIKLSRVSRDDMKRLKQGKGKKK